jgi:hypothetical protein
LDYVELIKIGHFISLKCPKTTFIQIEPVSKNNEIVPNQSPNSQKYFENKT